MERRPAGVPRALGRPVVSPWLVPFDGSFRVAEAVTAPPHAVDKGEERDRLEKLIERADDLQRRLYAVDRWAVLLVFQALDAAGKDGTIRDVLRGINPAGVQVHPFGRPSREELDHDFLWRTSVRLPERGRVGVFNRSHYEEVLVVRVHPELLAAQRLPGPPTATIWEERFASIRDHELHLAGSGTMVLKFWLHVSAEEQRRRLLRRIEDPERNWKFALADLDERARRDDYLAAYEAALNATSRPWAPWYAIPADDKPYCRRAVAEILVAALERLDLAWPRLDSTQQAALRAGRRRLLAERGGAGAAAKKRRRSGRWAAGRRGAG